MPKFRLSHFFDRQRNKATFLSEDFYEKGITSFLSSWTGEVVADLDALKSALKKWSGFSVVKDIAERDDLVNSKPVGILCWVEDATGDETVKIGGAAYLLKEKDKVLVWEKLSESESMDVVLDASLIVDGPEKLGEVDDMVEKAHVHDHLSVLDGISSNEKGNIVYHGITLNGTTGIDTRATIEEMGSFTSRMKIVKEVILPDIDGLSLYLYCYQPLRP